MRTKFLAIILALFFATTLAFAGQAGEYYTKKLPNGQVLIIKRVSQNPIVTIDTWIDAGSVNETDKNSGVAHFLEHLFFKGTLENPPGKFDTILESKGALTNAATSKDYTHYYITIPSKDFDLALKLHADMLLNPLIPRKELEKERKVVVEEISRSEDSPSNVMYNNLFKLLYESSKHPYHRPVLGNVNVINSITRDEILEFYKQYYTPHNMYTIVVGDVDPDDVMRKVEAEFGANAEANKQVKKESAGRIYPKIAPILKPVKISTSKDVKNEYMIMAFRTKKFSDHKDLYALDVLSAILGEGKSSRLNQILKEEKQLVNSINTSSSAYMQDGLFTIQANFEQKNHEKVEKEIFNQIDLIRNGEISNEDIAKAKNMIETQTYYSRESITNISNELGYYALYSGGISYYENYINNIKKVSKKDVIAVAKKYLNPEHVAISTVVPHTHPVSNVIPIVSKNYEAKVLEKNNKTTKYLLSNGAELIIEKNPNNSIIAIDINNKSGNHIEKIPSTLALAAALAKEGTKNYSGKEFSQTLDEKGIELGLSAGNDSFSITVQTTKNELPSALALLNEIINYPSFPDFELEKVKKLKLAALKNLEDNSLAYALDSFKALAFEGTVYGNNSEVFKRTIPTITRSEIERDYRTSLDPKNLVIAVVGDVDDEKIINEFSAIFTEGNAKKVEIKDFKKPNFEPKKDIEKTIVKKDNQTAWLLIGFKTTDIFNEKEIATLKIINTIMGEGMSSRLFKNLRDAEGLAYQVGTSNLQGALDGVFIGYIGTNEKNLASAKKGILSEFNILRTEFVPKDELAAAKDKVMGNMLISLETNMDNAQLQSYNASLGRDINYLEKYKKAIENVSQNDILTVANKYFSKPYIMVVVRN